MSSACRCHTEEWCFYCEMYSPLEQKYENQRLAIERVIADLEKKNQESKERRVIYRRNESHGSWASECGRIGGLNYAIDKLKEVLSQHGADDSSGVPKTDGAEAKQIPRKENIGRWTPF